MVKEELDLSDIKTTYPSICYTCENARKPASDVITKKGYVGCTLRVLDKVPSNGRTTFDWEEINKAKEIAEGWVDLRSRVKLGKGSGITTNKMLLTLEVESCNQHTEL